MKAETRARIWRMPRVKHRHNTWVRFKVQGNRLRYRCIDCPYVDHMWYPVSLPEDRAKRNAFAGLAKHARKAVDGLSTAGWLSGSEGTIEAPDGPQGQGFEIVSSEVRDDGHTFITEVRPLSAGPDLYPAVPANTYRNHIEKIKEGINRPYDPRLLMSQSTYDELLKVDQMLDADHPHSDLPPEPELTMDKLQQLDKKQLQTIAVTFEAPYNTKTTKAQLIERILDHYRK